VAFDGDEAARGELQEDGGDGFAVGIADEEVPQRGGREILWRGVLGDERQVLATAVN